MPKIYLTLSDTFYVQKNQCGHISYDTVFVAVNPLGLHSYTWQKEYKIVPNPNNGSFRLQYSGNAISGKVIVYDLTGRVLLENSFTTTNFIQVDLKAQPGIYLVKIVDDQNQARYLGKFVVQ